MKCLDTLLLSWRFFPAEIIPAIHEFEPWFWNEGKIVTVLPAPARAQPPAGSSGAENEEAPLQLPARAPLSPRACLVPSPIKTSTLTLPLGSEG